MLPGLQVLDGVNLAPTIWLTQRICDHPALSKVVFLGLPAIEKYNVPAPVKQDFLSKIALNSLIILSDGFAISDGYTPSVLPRLEEWLDMGLRIDRLSVQVGPNTDSVLSSVFFRRIFIPRLPKMISIDLGYNATEIALSLKNILAFFRLRLNTPSVNSVGDFPDVTFLLLYYDQENAALLPHCPLFAEGVYKPTGYTIGYRSDTMPSNRARVLWPDFCCVVGLSLEFGHGYDVESQASLAALLPYLEDLTIEFRSGIMARASIDYDLVVRLLSS
jgi:hypothetical protein